MMKRKTGEGKSKKTSLASQIKKVTKKGSTKKIKKPKLLEIPTASTGSTLLDLAISGEAIKGGGIPYGVMVEIFGPEGAGKTVMLCEIAGSVQRQSGEVVFCDPEARLNRRFAELFDVSIDDITYAQPDTVNELFGVIQKYKKELDKQKSKADKKGKSTPVAPIGIMADSLAALSTEMEMEKGQDKMGAKRAKDFSEGFRKICRVLSKNQMVMVCSNQIRDVMDSGHGGPRTESPGGRAIKFYASIRIKINKATKEYDKKKIKGKEIKECVAVSNVLEIVKNSVDKPYRKANIRIQFDYGVDDIYCNLQYVKERTGATTYAVAGQSLSNTMKTAIEKVEELGLEQELKDQVTELWYEERALFANVRKRKKR